MANLKSIQHQPRCKSWDEVWAMESLQEEVDVEDVEEVEDGGDDDKYWRFEL